MGLPCLCRPPLSSSVFPGLQRGPGRARGGSRRNQLQCCQGCGLLDHCPFFVANGDNGALISRMGIWFSLSAFLHPNVKFYYFSRLLFLLTSCNLSLLSHADNWKRDPVQKYFSKITQVQNITRTHLTYYSYKTKFISV